MTKDEKIYVAGHRGMVGSAILNELKSQGFTNLVFRRSDELDLRDQKAVTDFFDVENPEYVFVAAAKVGGILANNTYRAEFIYDNLMIQNNVIHESYKHGVKKLLFLGSSCIYPKLAPQPLKEEYLLTGILEPTNEPYAIAKIAGIKMVDAYRSQYGCNYISVMPTNLYGSNDNFDLEKSHVLPALLSKMHNAKINNERSVTIWGTGKPFREFLHVDDAANACVFLMQNYNEGGFINLGYGNDSSILELAEKIKAIVGFTGDIIFDNSKPDGTPKKLLDISKLKQLGWDPTINLQDGIEKVYSEKFILN